jgi:hypothetical protein
MKYVAEERTVQVPRVVEKKTPYTYTVRSPRVVVTKVPLDPCGNPIAPAAAVMPAPALSAPAAAARPAAAAAPAAPALQQEAAGPVKTYSDRPAESAAKAEEGWAASDLPHKDPAPAAGGEAVRAEKPAAEADAAEAIPSPSARGAEREPTVAPLGPVVEPAMPAHDTRDVPATGTSGRPLLRSLNSGHTT